MKSEVNQLVQSILQKSSLDTCNEQELLLLTERYPFFSAGHFLLAAKLKSTGSNQLEEQLRRSQLFFSSPLWIDGMINEKGTISVEEKAPMLAKNNAEELNYLDETETLEEKAEEIETQEPSQHITGEKEIEINNSFSIEESTVSKDETIQSTTEIKAGTEENFEEFITDKAADEPLSIPALKIEQIDPATATLSFEPYHTVDYFASQGIKIRDEEKSRDKFGQQLKSFTEWLKTIKKVPASEIAAVAEGKTDTQVDQLAAHSLAEGKVETEAMAEVWAKQGNHEKAIGIYKKLSLLNPSKSSYFASLIEQLKKS